MQVDQRVYFLLPGSEWERETANVLNINLLNTCFFLHIPNSHVHFDNNYPSYWPNVDTLPGTYTNE